MLQAILSIYPSNQTKREKDMELNNASYAILTQSNEKEPIDN